MKYTDFRTQVWAHLGKYKRDVLKVTDDVTIGETNYEHILPKGQENKNLFLIGCEFQLNENKLIFPNHKEIHLHTHWNHLSSSQILCISYFSEFLNKPQKLDELLAFLGINKKALNGEFEVVAGEEGTNVDFTINLEGGNHVYFEIKYTEPDFGSINYKTDCKKYQDYFKGCHKGASIEWDDYKKYYQIVRNVCLSENGNYTIFLLPRSNDSINSGYEKGIRKIKNFGKFRNSVKRVMWEDLLIAFPNNNVFEKYFNI